MALETYQTKRDFMTTPEPRGQKTPAGMGDNYLVQKHDARRLALRPAPGNGRRAQELGGRARAEPRARRETPRGAGRGSSPRIWRVRGHDPKRRVWRGHRDLVGPRPVEV